MSEKLKQESGLRMTVQREEVLRALRCRDDHPTASEVFVQVREQMPTISLATVYNCLEALQSHGIINGVHMAGGGPSRYCANLEEHAHFHCTDCGSVFDVPVPDKDAFLGLLRLPDNTTLGKLELTVEGRCPSCSPSPVNTA